MPDSDPETTSSESEDKIPPTGGGPSTASGETLTSEGVTDEATQLRLLKRKGVRSGKFIAAYTPDVDVPAFAEQDAVIITEHRSDEDDVDVASNNLHKRTDNYTERAISRARTNPQLSLGVFTIIQGIFALIVTPYPLFKLFFLAVIGLTIWTMIRQSRR